MEAKANSLVHMLFLENFNLIDVVSNCKVLRKEKKKIFLPHNSKPRYFYPEKSEGLYLVQRIRDESTSFLQSLPIVVEEIKMGNCFQKLDAISRDRQKPKRIALLKSFWFNRRYKRSNH